MTDLIQWLLKQFQALADWFKGLLDSLFRWIVESVLGAVASLIESIPVPDWLSNAGSVFAGIPSDVVYFLDMAAFGPGIAIVLSALLLRWLIRRLPIVG